VQVGGVEAAPVCGVAPQAPAGLLQVLIRIPEEAPVGRAVPLTLQLGGVAAQAGVTVSVR